MVRSVLRNNMDRRTDLKEAEGAARFGISPAHESSLIFGKAKEKCEDLEQSLAIRIYLQYIDTQA